MANYRTISTAFWTDSKVDDDFTPEDKYFYLYLLTNPHTNICGCYEISMKQMERETGYNQDTVKRLIYRMEKNHNVIRYSEDTKEVLLINWGKYNWSASEKVKKAVLSVAEYIKNDSFKKYVIDRVSIGYSYDMVPSISDTEPETVTETVTGTELETELETEYRDRTREKAADKPQQRSRFIPPTVDEVSAYCREKGYQIDPERFVDFYTSNGWMVGKNKMRDWQAAVRQWEKRDQERSGNNYQQPSRSAPAPSVGHSSIDQNDLDFIIAQSAAGVF